MWHCTSRGFHLHIFTFAHCTIYNSSLSKRGRGRPPRDFRVLSRLSFSPTSLNNPPSTAAEAAAAAEAAPTGILERECRDDDDEEEEVVPSFSTSTSSVATAAAPVDWRVEEPPLLLLLLLSFVAATAPPAAVRCGRRVVITVPAADGDVISLPLLPPYSFSPLLFHQLPLRALNSCASCPWLRPQRYLP